MEETIEHAIAVIGMAGRFPGASEVQTFWKHVCDGKESIAFFEDGEPELNQDSLQYVKARGILEGVESFDSDFFGMTPLEAQLTDPQHRLFLECAFEALENAGYDPERYKGAIGVYAGCSRSTYFLHNLYPHSDLMEKMGDYLIRLGNESDYFTTKVSYRLNLKGPSVSVQSACSTSLVAVCMACNHLLTYQCDVALAGGASVFLPQQSGYNYQKGMIFSPDGHCRPFDDKAQGTVPGNGVGVVVLKRLEDALADGDSIDAIIRGYGLNNDGAGKIGYSAPSVQGQADAIVAAISMAGVDASTIGYVEAHGTGTALGDPIEMKALSRAFQAMAKEGQVSCRVGSVKGNIGHLMEASGVAGLMKAVMALKHRKIPPTLHFTKLNPHIDSMKGAFSVSGELEEWEECRWPRRAGVSSFGFGGTNAHVVLEEAPEARSRVVKGRIEVLPLSAKTPEALERMALELGNYLRDNPTLSLCDVAYTLQVGRKEWKCRKAFVCDDMQAAIAMLLGERVEGSSSQELLALAEKWTAGGSVDWKRFHGEEFLCRVPLPTYPFERKRCWIDPPKEQVGGAREVPSAVLTEDPVEVIEEKLISIWKALLGREQVGREDNFFSLGGESLMALQMLQKIETATGACLSLRSLYEAPTIAELAQLIYLKTAIDSSDDAEGAS